MDAELQPNLPNEQYPVPTVEELNNITQKIDLLAEGINGPNTFSTESAAYGYIARHLRLVVPVAMREKITRLTINSYTEEPAPDRFLNVVDQLCLMYWNFVRMHRAGVNRDIAFFIAAYRTRLIYLGYLYTTRDDRSVTIDEVDFTALARDFHGTAYVTARERVAAIGIPGEEGYQAEVTGRRASAYATAFNLANNNQERIQAYVEHGLDENFKRFIRLAMSEEYADIIKHVVLAAQQFAASTYLVFRQLGHHYKTEFDLKYNILWKATTLEKHAKYPGNEAIHRWAIHSFGVKALHDKFYHSLKLEKLADTFKDRQDVAPAGTAVIATCYAAIELMKGLPVWSQMYAAYKVQIDALEKQAKVLKEGEKAIRFHKNARLFGETRYVMETETAQALAPIAKGFITALGDEADLSKQKALDKRAQQNPLMVQVINNAIIRITRSIARTGDMSALIQAAPAIASTSEVPEAKISLAAGEAEESESEEEE